MSSLTVGGLELRDLSAGYWFEIINGGPDDIATVRGTDDIVPGASGRASGAWAKDVRTLRLHGIVAGEATESVTAAESFRTRMDALVAKMDPTALVDVVAYAPYLGLASGKTATLSDCRPQNITGNPSYGDEVREMILELQSIDSPPDWVVA